MQYDELSTPELLDLLVDEARDLESALSWGYDADAETSGAIIAAELLLHYNIRAIDGPSCPG